jgi:hypothetical protein
MAAAQNPQAAPQKPQGAYQKALTNPNAAIERLRQQKHQEYQNQQQENQESKKLGNTNLANGQPPN